MHAKRFAHFLALALLCLTLSGCTTDGIPITDSTPTVTLPPAEVSFVAPIGDAALEYIADATLYLPSHDGISLTTVETEVAYSPVRPAAETLVRALLSHAGTKEATSLGGDVRLSLYGTSPVEVSRDTVTVNLNASALQLSREQLFLTCQAIANTLTELEQIHYVNILVVDKPVGLNIANTLPMGALKHSTAKDLGAVYKQLLSRRVESTDSSEEQPFSSDVTLYFPLNGTEGLVSEVRSLSFENQLLPDMVIAILRELAAGPQNEEILSPSLPLLADLLSATPVLISSEEAGCNILSLEFAHNLEDMLEAYGITKKQSLASICCTMATFLPNVGGIQVTIGGQPVEDFLLSETESSTGTFYLRSVFSSMLLDYCTLYFANQTEEALVSTRRPVPYSQATSPRTLMCELSKGPQVYDTVPGLVPVMTGNFISDTDMLGFSLTDGTLLANLSPSFFNHDYEMTANQERLLAYSIVNTLCYDLHIKSICFFESGTQFEGFTGTIYWAGLFYPLPE